MVLTEKTLLCQSRRVQLNAVANGSCLGFIEAGDLYALFANALDYAMESAVQTARPECRIIDLLVCVRQSFMVVNVISPAARAGKAGKPYRGLRAESDPPYRTEIQRHPDHGKAERILCEKIIFR